MINKNIINLSLIMLFLPVFISADYYRDGLEAYKNKDFNKSIKLFKKAKDKNGKSKLKLGLMYLYGDGVNKNCIKALLYIKQSIAQNNMNAKAVIASLYREGVCVKKKPQKALNISKELATKGHMHSQIILGLIYKLGAWTNKNYSKSLKYFKMASKQGSPLADYEIGMFYCKGKGVQKDKKVCIEYLINSASKGYKKAEKELKLIAAKKQSFWELINNKYIENIIQNINNEKGIHRKDLKLYKIVIYSYLHSSSFFKHRQLKNYAVYSRKELAWYRFLKSSLIYFKKTKTLDKVLVKNVILKHLQNAYYVPKNTSFELEHIVAINAFENIYKSGILKNYKNKKPFLKFVPPNEYDFIKRLKFNINRTIEKFNLLYRSYQLNLNEKPHDLDIGFLHNYPEKILDACHDNDHAKIKKLSLEIQKFKNSINKKSTVEDNFNHFPIIAYHPENDFKNCIESIDALKLYKNITAR